MDRHRFESICSKNKMTPVAKEQTPWGTILVGEAFRFDPKNNEFPFGCYHVLWAIDRDGMLEGHDLFFDAFHDPKLEKSDKKRARISAAINHAAGWMRENEETGRYDA